MKYVKYMPNNSIINASRNKREIEAVLELGLEVSIFSDDKVVDEGVISPKISIIWDKNIPLDYSIPRIKRYALILINKMRILVTSTNLPNGIWSCHDIAALKTAYVATLFRRKKVQLVYDSHEYELGRNAKRNKLQLFFIRHLEKFLMKRCVFSIMVNDCIADEVQRIHRLKQRPIVVRSTPNLWAIDPQTCLETREMLMSKFDSGGRSY